MNFIKNRISLGSALIIVVIILIVRVNHKPQNYLSYDNFGSYLYLPSLFIYNDLKLDNMHIYKEINEKYNCTPNFYQVVSGPNGNLLIRFYMGMAVIFLPFFLLGHLIANITGYPADGFSLPYQWALFLGGLIYTIIGVFILRKVLLKFLADRIVAITLIMIYWGSITTLFVVYGNDSPHGYLLALYGFLLWFTIKWHETLKIRYAVFLGIVIGMILLARPSEIIAVFIPLLWGVDNLGALKEKYKLIIKKKFHFIVCILVVFAFGSLQLLYYKVYAGKFFFFSYDDPGSGFDFLSPYFIKTLFGFRKGIFIYSPVLLLMLTGLFIIYKQNRKLFYPLFVFTLLNFFIICSYSSLISYGYRAFVQSFAVLSISLGYFIKFIYDLNRKIWLKILFSLFLLLILLYNVSLSNQIFMGKIDGSRTTKEYFLKVFFKNRIDEDDKKLLLVERSKTAFEEMPNDREYIISRMECIDFESIEENKQSNYDSTFAFSGKYSFRMDSIMIYSPGYKIPYDELSDNYYVWIRASVYVYPVNDIIDNEALLVVSFQYEGVNHKYRAFSIKNEDFKVVQGKWNKISIDYLSPELRSRKEEVRVYVWYRGKKDIYIDDLKIEVFEPKN